MSLAFVYTWPVWIHSFSFCPSSHWKGGRKGDSTPPQPPPKWHLTHSSFMLFIHPWPLISRSPVFTNNNSSDYSLDCNSTENHPWTCMSSLRLLTSAEHYRSLQIDPSFHTVYVKKHPATGLHSDICPLHSCPKCPTAKRPERIPAKTAPVTDY